MLDFIHWLLACIILLVGINIYSGVQNRDYIVSVIKSEAQKNRAIESEGRCYRLLLPEDE